MPTSTIMRQCTAILLLLFFIRTNAQDLRAFNQNASRSNHTRLQSQSDDWTFGLNSGASFGVRSNEGGLFRGTGMATKLFGRYQFGNMGLGFSSGIIPGAISNNSLNQFIIQRKFQQSQVTKSNPFNSYLLFGPSLRFGSRVIVNADIQGGMFINNPGSVSIGQTGAVRSLYRFESAGKNLFPGFSGNISLAYPINNSTRFFINSDYLHSKSSIRLYDPQQGVDIAIDQDRLVKLFTVGVGITKSFGSKRESATGMATGKKHIGNVKYENRSMTEDEADDERIIATTQRHAINTKGTGATSNGRIIPIAQYHAINTKGTGASNGRIISNENCGPVTQKITNPDGTVEEKTFACPVDAALYNERISMKTTVPKQTQGTTFGEKVNAGLHSAGGMMAQGASLVGGAMPGANILSGAVSIQTGNSSGILTNQNAISSVGALSGGAGGGAAAASYAATGRVINNAPGLQGINTNIYARDTKTGQSTGRRQYQKIYAEGLGNVCSSCDVLVNNNPLYEDKGQAGVNPLFEGKAVILSGGIGKTGDKYEQQADAMRGNGGNLCGSTSHFIVALINSGNGEAVATTRTDSCGNFWFANIPDGDYTVRLEGGVAVQKRYDVTIPANKKYDIAGEILAGDAHWVVNINGQKTTGGVISDNAAMKSITIKLPLTIGGESYEATEKNSLYNGPVKENQNPMYNSSAIVAGTPIGGIIVKGGKNPGGNLRTTQTNENGEFEFSKLKSGNYLFTAEVNYLIANETIVTFSGEDNNIFRKGWDGTVKGGSVAKAEENINSSTNKSGAQDHNSSRSNKTASTVDNNPGDETPGKPIVSSTKSNTKDLLASLDKLDQLLNADKTSTVTAVLATKENSRMLRTSLGQLENSLQNAETTERAANAADTNFAVLLGSVNKLGQQYSSISNVLKTRHEIAMNSIRNMK